MTTGSSVLFLPWASSSSDCPMNPQSRLLCGGISPPGLLPSAISLPSIDNADHKAQAQVENSLSVFQEVVGGRSWHSRDIALVLNCLQVSSTDNSRRLDLFLNTARRRSLESTSSQFSEGFHSEEFGSEAAIADEQQNRSAAPLSGTIVRERKEMLRNEKAQQGLWSVVVPTYNRLPILSKCLHALEEQRDYSMAGIESYEVIVVDDGSTDGTVEFLTNGSSKNRALLPRCDEISRGGMLWKLESDTDWDLTTRRKGRQALRMGSGMSSNLKECPYEEFEDSYSVLQHSERFPHVRLVQQKHAGATTARNLGLKYAKGAIIVFIDSDLVVTENFLKAHGEALRDAFLEDGDDRAFTYGRVVNTSNFHDPKSERVKLTDYSAAFFATGNVAISHRRLLEAGELLGCDADGPFDVEFSEYGWEDLELGVRLKQCGARIKHAPAAVGYHWHPAFSIEQLPKLIEQERQRGRNGVRFYRKHPTLNVRLMIQMTPFHEILWFLLTLGGLLNERTLEPILRILIQAGRDTAAAALVSPILNWHTVQAAKEESRKLNVR